MKLVDHFKIYTLTEHQKQLVQKLEQFLDNSNSSSNVFLLKGYAGTGKTFITKGLTEYFGKQGRHYILAAPTGKAAKVIHEKTGSTAHTIHKTIYGDKVVEKSETSLVEYKKDELDRTYKFYFDLRVNEDSVDTVYIIDESSMISNVYSEMEFIRFGSGYLLNDLMKYINLDQNDHRKKIIFIGDNAQLPPVGMDFSPALNEKYLVDNFAVSTETYELKEVVRQKGDSGILQNAKKLRNALESKIFNQLEIDTTPDDIEELDSKSFIDAYMKSTNYQISKDSMVVSYTNASVTEYNQEIRKHFFNDISQIQVNDKIMVLTNNSNYDIFLSNGDFGLVMNILSDTEHKRVRLKRKNEETGQVEEIDKDLYFRDVEILFKDVNGIPYLIRCKIIENLLFSANPNLESDENKAIYLDFVMRHPYLKPNTKPFADAIKDDPYFNALKVKFGYAITCHKSQGSEWKNIFLNCKSHQNYLSEGYFRWLYTAMTRASENLFVLNVPKLGIFDGFKKEPQHMEHIGGGQIPKKTDNVPVENQFHIEDPFLLTVYYKIQSIIEVHGIDIIHLEHNQYQEKYTFKDENNQATVVFNYNKKQVITTIQILETNDLTSFLKRLFEPMIGHLLGVVQHSEKSFSFDEKFQKEFYSQLDAQVKKIEVSIENIEHMAWMERYTFVRGDEVAVIDFYYNKNGQFKSPTPNNKSNSKVLIQDILGVLS